MLLQNGSEVGHLSMVGMLHEQVFRIESTIPASCCFEKIRCYRATIP
jgi:hypothetical protein